MEAENATPQPTWSVETDPNAALQALLTTDPSARKRSFSALLRSVIDDRTQGV
jgi:hypothetical protein